MSEISLYLQKLSDRINLSNEEMQEVMESIMLGNVDNELLAAFLMGMAVKGISSDELAGCVEIMKHNSIQIENTPENCIDTCGTGGDSSGTFNISTTVAFIAAGADIAVAKHGNRAITSKSGSADVLQKLGINLELPPEKSSEILNNIGIVFLYAPTFHPAMKHAAEVRKKLKIKTFFNLAGPLTNPANTKRQVIGVYEESKISLILETLKKRNIEKAMVVHGKGLDEITLTGPSNIGELSNGNIHQYIFNPRDYGINTCDISELQGGDAEYNAEIIKKILAGEKGPKYDIAIINAAAAIQVADKADNWRDAIEMAHKSIESGKALEKLHQLIEYSHT